MLNVKHSKSFEGQICVKYFTKQDTQYYITYNKTWVVSSTYKINGRFSHAIIINFQTTTILLQMAIIDGHD